MATTGNPRPGRGLGAALRVALGVVLLLAWGVTTRADRVLYQTGFEAAEGYRTDLDLVGQLNWEGIGSGGNGILDGVFAGQGQQAYVGYAAPSPGYSNLYVYPRVDFPSTIGQATNLHFSVDMAVMDSTNDQFDDFHWAVFNAQGRMLAGLDFDNFATNINYFHDGTNRWVATGKSFAPNAQYRLTVDLDFPHNRWSARLGSIPLVSRQPITTAGATLALADLDAAQVVYDPAAPGDNYLVFDNYTLTAQYPFPASPRLRFLGRTNGAPALRLQGEDGWRFALDATTNLANWAGVTTNSPSGGAFDYVDTAGKSLPRRFYRARWVP